MPLVRMEDLPDNSRTWVFGADRDVEESSAKLLLREVDRFLSEWHAHGTPLTVARDWGANRFRTSAVDHTVAGAQGCSSEGLYCSRKFLDQKLGESPVTSGLIVYGKPNGGIDEVDRERFAFLSQQGKITADTRVFN